MDLNQLTLAMFSNKSMYRRHLERTDPEIYAKRQAYLDKIAKYQSQMRKMTDEFLENPEKDFNTEVNEMFEIFVNALLKYLEMKELDNESTEEDTEDTLFVMNDSTKTKTTKYYSKNRLDHFFEK